MLMLSKYYDTAQACSFPHIKFLSINFGGTRNLKFARTVRLNQTDCEKLPENLALVTSFKSAISIKIYIGKQLMNINKWNKNLLLMIFMMHNEQNPIMTFGRVGDLNFEITQIITLVIYPFLY